MRPAATAASWIGRRATDNRGCRDARDDRALMGSVAFIQYEWDRAQNAVLAAAVTLVFVGSECTGETCRGVAERGRSEALAFPIAPVF